MSAPNILLQILEGRSDAQDAAVNVSLTALAQELASLENHDPETLAQAVSSALNHGDIAADQDGADDLVAAIVRIFLASSGPSPQAAAYSLEALETLSSSDTIQSSALIRVAAHTNPLDPWTTPAAAASAASILQAQLPTPAKRNAFIRSIILEDYLRPLFSRSRSERITAAGRKAHFPPADPGRGADLTEDKAKPWKTGDRHAVAVFAWAVEHSDESLIQEAWPLYMPVLLALLDDGETQYRVHGLEIVRVFLSKCPSSRLRDTGVGDILAESILPTFNFLPSLTPEDESVRLLEAAFPAIIQLARSKFTRAEDTPAKRVLLGKLLREGVFTAYGHANQYVHVVEVLARQSVHVVDELGLAATSFLKDLIPIYSEILSDPFMTRFPSSCIAAARGLKATMRNCWPRITTPEHQGEILKALTVGWLSLHEDDASPLVGQRPKLADEKLRPELTEAARMLVAISAAAGVDLSSETSQLCAKDSSLGALFGRAVNA